MLSDLFGFDKYAEVTSEHAIRGTYCDLAIKIEGKLRILLEVKAIGMTLNDKHIKQAVDYAANQGLDWVVLTNSVQWMLFVVSFKKPIDAKKLAEFDLLATNPKSDADLERVFLLTREGLLRGAIQEFSQKQDATSRYLLASLLLHDDDVVGAIRRELRKMTDMLVEPDVLKQVLRNEVIKREALEGPEAEEAARLVVKRNRSTTPRPAKSSASDEPAPPQDSESATA